MSHIGTRFSTLVHYPISFFSLFRTLHPNRPHLRISNEYYRLRNTLVDCELFLIRILGFSFSI